MRWKRFIALGDGYPFAVVAVLVAAAVLFPLRPHLPTPLLGLLLVPVIVAIARLSGVRASSAAAVLAFLCLDVLFVPPYYRLTIAEPSAWIGLLVFLFAALVTGGQTGRLHERERAGLLRQRELELLNRMSFRVASEKSEHDIADFVVRQIVSTLGARRAALYLKSGPGLRIVAEVGQVPPSDEEATLVRWVLREGKAIGITAVDVPADQRPVSVGSDQALPGVVVAGTYLPLQTADWFEGVLFTLPGHPEAPTPDEARLLAALANLSAACLERQALESAAAHADALREADRLKSTLVSSVSHELKTPLAAATASVTGLLDEEAHDPQRLHDELSAVAEALARLDASIGDLLDLSRLESDAWEPRVERYDVGEILGAVLAKLPAAQQRRIVFEIADPAPEVRVDFTQLVRALTNLVENALAYSAEGDNVVVRAFARTGLGEVMVEVIDHGPGVSDEEKPHVFEKFYRGRAAASAPGGSGLGLAIAAEIARSHGGRIHVADAEGGGAVFSLTLPAAEEDVQ